MLDNTFYFTDEEYDVFKLEKQNSISKETRDIRDSVKEKLLKLDKELSRFIVKNGYDLHTHYNPQNTVSSTRPNVFNKGMVNWLGIRYGKSEPAIKALNEFAESKADKSGFQKYACLQLDIVDTGVDIGIYFAVPHDSIDRMIVHQYLDNDQDGEYTEKLIKCISTLKGYGYKWSVSYKEVENYKEVWKEAVFDIDSNDAEKFIEFFNKYDREGAYSSMLQHYPRYDDRIKSDKIVLECEKIFSQLYELYQLMTYHAKKVEG